MKITPRSDVIRRQHSGNHYPRPFAQAMNPANWRPVLYLLISLVLAALLWLPVETRAADPISMGVVEAIGMGTVDRTRFKNRVQAKIMARRAAVVDGQRNLLEVIEGVRVTSGTTVKDAQLESDVIANRLKGFLQGAYTTNENVIEEDGEFLVELTMRVCLNASTPECRGKQSLGTIIKESLPETPADEVFTPEPETLEQETAQLNTPVTGLIVDMTNMDFNPFFDVRLVTESGKEVYGPGSINTQGDWLHWSDSIPEASSNTGLIGSAPLTLVPARTTPEEDIVLSPEDANRLYAANNANGDFLSQGKVVFVLK
ncbi:MAG: hypothetical protein AAF525_11245 [Pseudomonadota bacterium]